MKTILDSHNHDPDTIPVEQIADQWGIPEDIGQTYFAFWLREVQRAKGGDGNAETNERTVPADSEKAPFLS